jgi:isopentenyl-diphosphate delta-isomerase
MKQIDEYLDLVDENDNVIGRKRRTEIYAEKLSNFRVVNAFIINSSGEIWIPRRHPNKKSFPLSFDMSIGGHVESGETYESALTREAQEELNLNIDDLPVHFLGHLNPQKDAVSAYMKVYEIEYDKRIDFNKNDFLECFWLTPKEIIRRIANGEKAKSDLLVLLKLFY